MSLLLLLHHLQRSVRPSDSLIIQHKDPLAVMRELEGHFQMKGVGAPRHCLGGDVHELDPQWHIQELTHSFSAETYIQNCIPKMLKLYGIDQFKTSTIPMDPEYHPELDKSPLMDADGVSKHRSVIGSLNWILTLGRFDIAYSLNTMNRHCMAPRVGHWEAMKKIFGYLKKFQKGQIIIDPMIHLTERLQL